MSRKAENLEGNVYGRWTVLVNQDIDKPTYALCKCDCGVERLVQRRHLKSGVSKSCGCLATDNLVERSTTHGMRNSITYGSWKSMKNRCLNPNHKNYDYYQSKHICDEWVDSFENFYADMGERPSIHHTIDRIDNSKGYNKNNCRWATKKEQIENREYRSSYWKNV